MNNAKRNKYNIPMFEYKKEINKKDRFIEILSDSVYLHASNTKIEDLSCDDFKDFYSSWSSKDIKSLIKIMEA